MKKILKTFALLSVISLQLNAWNPSAIQKAITDANTQELATGLANVKDAFISESGNIEDTTGFGKQDMYETLFKPIRKYINNACDNIVKDRTSDLYTGTTTIVNANMEAIEDALNAIEDNKSLQRTLLMPFHVLMYWLSEDGWYLGERTQRILEGLKSNIVRLNTEIEVKEQGILELESTNTELLNEKKEQLEQLKKEAQKITVLTESIDKIKEERDALQLNIVTLKTQIETLKKAATGDAIIVEQLKTQVGNLQTAQTELRRQQGKKTFEFEELKSELIRTNDENKDLAVELEKTKRERDEAITDAIRERLTKELAITVHKDKSRWPRWRRSLITWVPIPLLVTIAMYSLDGCSGGYCSQNPELFAAAVGAFFGGATTVAGHMLNSLCEGTHNLVTNKDTKK